MNTQAHCVFCSEVFTPDVKVCPRCRDYKGVVVGMTVEEEHELDRRIADYLALPAFYTCGVCGYYHSVTWQGDCKDEGCRWTQDMLDDWYGSEGWREERLEP